MTAAGLTIVLAGLAAGAVIGLLDAAGVDRVPEPGDVGPSLLALVGFGILGLVDDVLPRSSGGVRGHVAALAGGEITGGMVKLAGGAAVGVVVASYAVPSSSAAGVVRDGALVALAANLANLLDLAPGRTTKVATLAWISLTVAAGTGSALSPSAFVVGGAIGLLVPEMRERCMLGDTGANAVGGVLGLGVVLVAAPVGAGCGARRVAGAEPGQRGGVVQPGHRVGAVAAGTRRARLPAVGRSCPLSSLGARDRHRRDHRPGRWAGGVPCCSRWHRSTSSSPVGSPVRSARGSPPRRSAASSRAVACGSRCRSSTRTSTSTRAP